ncbi:hypothetical protein CAEBREN_02469 [Caenorhabditis brenneri]|uniref:Uncharacterized protein n=1 Tax=Caenorhabditis brenneri TaxID=135651 RepID=G0MLP0_CAEBE|nr:hypothetical protein CAEBREN_02469 [Caenorhabditis brenneri]
MLREMGPLRTRLDHTGEITRGAIQIENLGQETSQLRMQYYEINRGIMEDDGMMAV